MQIGDFSLMSTFRYVSQHEKQGIIAVKGDGIDVEIVVADGRIMGAKDLCYPLAQGMLHRMSYAGLIEPEQAVTLCDADAPVGVLYATMVEGGLVSRELFLQIKDAYELDLLHSLRQYENISVEFHPQLVFVNRDIAIPRYPTQLLLDMLEIDTNRSHFEETFGGYQSQAVQIERAVSMPRGLTTSEAIVWEVIADGITPADIFAVSILSVHQAQEALLTLQEQQFIRTFAEGEATDELALPDVIVAPPTVAQHDVEVDLTVTTGEEERILNMIEANDTIDSNSSAASFIAADPYSFDVAFAAAEQATAGNNVSTIEEEKFFANEENEIAEDFSIDEHLVSGGSDVQTQHVLLGTMLVFLAALGWIVPSMLTDLFKSLSVFAANQLGS